MKAKHFLYRTFNILFVILFLIILCGSVLDNQSQIKIVKALPLIISSLIIAVFLAGIYQFLIRRKVLTTLTLKKEIIIFSFLMIGILALEILCGILLRTSGKHFDLGYMIDMAYNIANGGEIPSTSIAYYTVYPDNNFVIFLLIYVYKIFFKMGIQDRVAPGIALNIFLVTSAIIIFYLTVRKLWGSPKALFMLGFTYLLTPLFLSIPIFYTDTLSMIFIMAQIYIYLLWKEQNEIKGKIIYFILLSFVVAFGIKVKSIVLIMCIAIYIDMLIKDKDKIKSMGYIILSSMFILAILLGLNFYMNRSGYFEAEVAQKKIPYTHWVMMGLGENVQFDKAIYTEDDYQFILEEGKKVYGVWKCEEFFYTVDNWDPVMDFFEILKNTNLTYEQMDIRCKDQIKARLEQRGILGTLEFEYKKLIQTWGDGTYYAPVKISRLPIVKDHFLADIVRIDGKYFTVYNYFAHAIQIIMLSMIIITTMIAIHKEDDLTVLRIAIFGLMLLLVIWETRSRYVLSYLLILEILAVPGFDWIAEKIRIHAKNC